MRWPIRASPGYVGLTLRDGSVLTEEVHDYPGFVTRAMSWEMAFDKFEGIASASATSASRRSIGDAVKNLEHIKVKDLTRLLNNLEASQNYAPKAFSAGKEE